MDNYGQNQFGIGQQPQFAQPGAGVQYNPMFNNMGVPEMPAAQPDQVNPNEWQLLCDKDHPEVEAEIRILPRGLEGVQGSMWPHVNSRVHYLKTRDGKRWGDAVVCRENLPDPTRKRGKAYCPLCDKVWNRYYDYKNKYGEKAVKELQISGNLATDDIYVNVLVIKDYVNPANNGQIKIWHAKSKQWDKVMSALPANNTDKNGNVRQQYTGTPKYIGIPWHVLQGSTFHLKGVWDTTKSFTSGGVVHTGVAVWEGSYFDPNPTPIATSNETIMSILGQCFNLSEYEKPVKSVEEVEKIALDFFAAYDGPIAAMPDTNNNFGANGYPAYAQQPMYGQQPGMQPGMQPASPSPYMPPQRKTTIGNAGALFNTASAPNYGVPPQQMNPRQNMFGQGQPNFGAPNAMPNAAAPASAPFGQFGAPAQGQMPGAAPAPNAVPGPAAVTPQFGAPAPAGAPGATPSFGQFGAPAAPMGAPAGNAFNASPAAPAPTQVATPTPYTPPAAPEPQAMPNFAAPAAPQPSTNVGVPMAQPAGNAPVFQAEDGTDLPF